MYRDLDRIHEAKFKEEELTEKRECIALTSNLEGTVLNCVKAKTQYQRDTPTKIFDIPLNCFGSERNDAALRETKAT